jgi:hypothetical protein
VSTERESRAVWWLKAVAQDVSNAAITLESGDTVMSDVPTVTKKCKPYRNVYNIQSLHTHLKYVDSSSLRL